MHTQLTTKSAAQQQGPCLFKDIVAEVVLYLQVALHRLTQHVDRAAHANDSSALEYVQTVLTALETTHDNTYWGFFFLMASGKDLVSYLVRPLQPVNLVCDSKAKQH